MHAGELSAALWAERRTLEQLINALQAHADPAAVSARTDALRDARLYRDLQLVPVLDELGLRADGALEDVVGAELPSPWNMLLPEHVQALQGLWHQLDQLDQLRPPAQH